jgi:transcriptional regulator with XRE-family HTH domain
MLPTTTVQLRSPDAFRAAMTKAELSSRALAKRAGCSPSRIGQLMVDRDPSVAGGQSAGIGVGTAAAIAAALDVDLGDLFEFPDGAELVRLGLIRVA